MYRKDEIGLCLFKDFGNMFVFCQRHPLALEGLRDLVKNTWSLDIGRFEELWRHVLIGEESFHVAKILVNFLLHLLSGLPYLKPFRCKPDESEFSICPRLVIVIALIGPKGPRARMGTEESQTFNPGNLQWGWAVGPLLPGAL